MKNTYLARLKRQNRKLYRFVVAFVIGSVLLIQTRYTPFMFFDLTPVYTWGMFSTALNPAEHQHYTFYTLKYDGQTFNLPTYNDHKKIFFTYTILHYDRIAGNGYTDPANQNYAALARKLHLPDRYAERMGNTADAVQQYPAWLKRYMSQNLGQAISTIEVTKYWTRFDEQAQLITDSSKVLIHE